MSRPLSPAPLRLAVAAAFAAVALLLVAPTAHADNKPATKKKKPAAEEKAPPPVKPAPPPEEEEEYGPKLPPPPETKREPTDEELELRQRPAFKMTRGRFILGAKVGGAFGQPFGVGASFAVGLEVGWALPKLPVVGEGFALTIDGIYTQPGTSGDQTDPRIAANGGAYSWSVTQRELSIGLTVLYRAPFVMGGKLVPYVGVGPRLFFIQSTTSGEAGAGNSLAGFSEQSSRVGVGVPLGADYAIGPGRVFLEAMLLWAPVNHNITGDGSAGTINVQAGYRLLL